MAHEQHLFTSEDTNEEGCKGCHVWAHIHEEDELKGWGDSSCDSDSSSDTIIQESYLESCIAAQMDVLTERRATFDLESEATSASYVAALEAMTDPEIENHYTVLIRLPFNRGDFVDPPPVAWSNAKERALWDIMSRQPKNSEVDWKALAERFEVTQPFLLQQAAWLYERQLSQVRAQMRRVGNRYSGTPSPVPGSTSASMVGGQGMKRAGSGGSRVPSRLSTQHAGSPVLGGGDSTPGTPAKSKTSLPFRPAASTAASGVTPQTRNSSSTARPLSRQSSKDAEATISTSQSRRGSIQHQLARSPGQVRTTQPDSPVSDDEMTPSRVTARRPNPVALHRRVLSYRKDMPPQKVPASDPEDETSIQQAPSEDDEPSFLPFANPSTESKPARPTSSSQHDLGGTLRGALPTQRPGMHRRTTSERIVSYPQVEPPTPVQTQRNAQDLASSTSSLVSRTHSDTTTNPGPRPSTIRQTTVPRLGTPLSPPHRTLLHSNQQSTSTAASPHRGAGSDSASPSMGSSFSDLDDASVTQSALEEALLAGMGNTTMTTNLGSIGGRMTSGIGQALRSRYFDARGEGQGRSSGQ